MATEPRELSRSYFSIDPVDLAPKLIGLIVSVRAPESSLLRSARIVECEAYRGTDDPASHAARKKTPRNAVMFGPAGIAYVYFNYGVHNMFNIVADDEGTAGAVLIRSAEPLTGINLMAAARGTEQLTELCSGPGKLTKALGIQMNDNMSDLLGGGRMSIIDDGWRPSKVVCGPRVGIRRGQDLCWRFASADSRHVSRPHIQDHGNA